MSQKSKANMRPKNQASQQLRYSENELRSHIQAKLLSQGIQSPENATADQLYRATVYTLKELIEENRNLFKKRMKAKESKKVCYLCMEFLVGRFLRNNVMNLGLYEALSNVLNGWGKSFDEVYACENDPGLGNGGLGRLAACFMDSLTAQDYAAGGYSLCYEQGLFKQRLVDGEQVELPDEWMLGNGSAWLYPRPEKSLTVRFGGLISEEWKDGRLQIVHTEYEEVRAVPYDVMIVGTETNAVNTIRLWRAREAHSSVPGYTTQGSYIKAMQQSGSAEEITRQLYPPDQLDEGKLLRLTQQYFLVSASLQSIIRDYFATNGSLAGFADKIAIHINDTHPALCIPELMRIFMDVYSFSWEDAWDVVTKCVTYTNHTVLPEALECWKIDLFRMKLPRIFTIVSEINRRFCADLWNLYPGDWDRISRMSVVAYGQVRMANLSVVASHTVNGVSALHSDILKKTVFHDFYKMTPWKFTNVTNGVVHRRWLSSANPRLTALIESCIGSEFKTNPLALYDFEKYASDASVIEEMGKIKLANKERFASWAKNKSGAVIDPNSVFDVHIKRLHEYKRQLLNLLKIMSLYDDICNGRAADMQPQTFIFGAKAAPGYQMAKRILKLAYFLGKEIESHPVASKLIKVVFMEEYNVSMAEVLIPAAEISEQISLAGKEASGTGNMKLMMNGALTFGTLDGANVEILEAVGDPNIYIFGMNNHEVEELWRNGYSARDFYLRSERLRAVVDRFSHPIGGQDFSFMAEYLLFGYGGVADPYMCLADFDSYCYEYRKIMSDYQNRADWNKRSLINVARSGVFASDVSINKYASDIWHAEPVN